MLSIKLNLEVAMIKVHVHHDVTVESQDIWTTTASSSGHWMNKVYTDNTRHHRVQQIQRVHEYTSASFPWTLCCAINLTSLYGPNLEGVNKVVPYGGQLDFVTRLDKEVPGDANQFVSDLPFRSVTGHSRGENKPRNNNNDMVLGTFPILSVSCMCGNNEAMPWERKKSRQRRFL